MRIHIYRVCVAALTAAAVLAGCAPGGKKELYEAEKALFNAQKMNRELVVPTMNPVFLEKTLSAYRDITARYGGGEMTEEMERIVVTAQMDLAELEFRSSMFDAARSDFATAYTLASRIPEARANALWSEGFISEQIGDSESAARLYEQFIIEFLSGDKAAGTARMNPRYMVTPIKLAGVHKRLGSEKRSEHWLTEAEKIYGGIIDSAPDSAMVREMRYNLLTVYLEAKRWDDALETVSGMKASYTGAGDISSLLFLEARIRYDGLGQKERALGIYRRIYDEHPESNEALSSLLYAAGIHRSSGETAEAEKIYRTITDDHGKAVAEAAEATWQLAMIAEERGDWLNASLLYRSLYTNYPSTIQGMEAPLKIANHFRDKGEDAAAEGAYMTASEHYRKLASQQYSTEIRVMAEEYGVRTLSEQGKWEEAADMLIDLVGRFPDYIKFRENYLMAASIYENEVGDPARAAEILRVCASRYPGTSLAGEAEKQIERILGRK